MKHGFMLMNGICPNYFWSIVILDLTLPGMSLKVLNINTIQMEKSLRLRSLF
ncbi:MAG: hypothetical protein JWP45_2228 [Mucilaginibacter sp.]|nr:hypothetical protein [Mucilaginibacter sp.]